MEREYWTYLDGTKELYEISNFGNVRNSRTKHNLTPQLKRDSNIVFVSLKNKKLNTSGKSNDIRKFLAHEVYRHFSEKPFIYDGYKVFHIDGDIWNNKFTNLAVLDHIHNKATREQQDIYNENIYKCVKSIVCEKYKIKGFDCENLIQESALTIWKYLPNFKPIRDEKKQSHKGFYGFCKHYVEMVAKRLLKQYYEFRLLNEVEERIFKNGFKERWSIGKNLCMIDI